METKERLFHIDDLALLWGIESKNTLRVTLGRAVKDGWLFRIQRGLYSLHPADKLDPVELGAACLHRYCYVSTETVLRDSGIILQNISAITFVSSISKRWKIGNSHFMSRRLSDMRLMHPAGIYEKKGILYATPERAVADMLYFDPWYHFDHPIDWNAIENLQKEIGYPVTPNRHASSARQ